MTLQWVAERCPGSGAVVSILMTGPGWYECIECHQFEPMRDGQILAHVRDVYQAT